MKKYQILVTFGLIFAHFTPYLVFAFTPSFADDIPEYEETYLVATAYYSPLPGQKYYLRGNYEKEVILNGNGTHGASGKPVFTGMLAAPKSYTFGTRIWVDGLGTGSVEDRGGAIVNAWVRGHAYDRIDIWMGSGEEGLARSLAWGKRTVKARVYTDKTSKIAFSTAHLTQARLAGSVAKSSTQMASTPSPQILKVASLEEKLEAFTKIRTSLESGLGTESVIQIRNTQNALRTLGYIKAPSTGTFGPSTRTAIRAFEESRGVMFRTKVLMSDETRQELATVLLARGIESIDDIKN